MAKVKTKQKSVAARSRKTFKLPKKWEHGDIFDIPTSLLEANEWNPNEMSAEEFDMLSENVEDVDFLDPLLVVPLPTGKFRIIDGEHRYEQQRLADASTIRCVVAKPERMDEVEQMRQTVRMNKIRGSMSAKKFSRLVEKLVEKSDMELEDLPHELGFVNVDEFQDLLDEARDALPTDDMKKLFDDARDELRTVDDLSLLLNKLFTQFGSTLPANFMILDFGGKKHIWVRMRQESYKMVEGHAREVMSHGFTFDSVVERMLVLLDVDEFIEIHRDFLEEVHEEQLDIDDLLGEVNDVD